MRPSFANTSSGPTRGDLARRRKRAITWGTVLLLIAVISSTWLGAGLLEGVGIAAAVVVLVAIGSFAANRWAARDQRLRTRLSKEARDCKGCGADLWGLDVLPASAGRYRIKCSECGVVTEFKPGRVSKAGAPPRPQSEQDTRSFKIR